MKQPRRKRNISPEVESFLANEGPELLRAFFTRYIHIKKSMRGRNYET